MVKAVQEMNRKNKLRARKKYDKIIPFILSVTVAAILALQIFIGFSLNHKNENQNLHQHMAAPCSSSTPPGDLFFDELLKSLNKKQLKRISSKLKDQYAHAYPYPHVVIDNLFPQNLLQKVVEENSENLMNENGCLSIQGFCYNIKGQIKKRGNSNPERMGPYTSMFFSYLKSSTFIDFLQDLTGIGGILPDPGFTGSGVHFVGSGGSLQIHADFNALTDVKLERRVNTFLFHPEWKDDYGGHLELWNKDMNKCGQRILPILGRFVVFSSTDFSFHGHPHPLTCPPNRVRRSLALYYYTVGRPAEECNGTCASMLSNITEYDWRTKWQTSVCGNCEDPACHAVKSAKYFDVMSELS